MKISNSFTFGIILLVFMVAIAWMAPAVHAAIGPKVDQGIEVLTVDLGTPEVAPPVSAIAVACAECLKLYEGTPGRTASAPDMIRNGLVIDMVQISGVIPSVGTVVL